MPFIPPMLAAAGSPTDPANGWAAEVKFDGIRAQLHIHDGTLTVRSRPGRDCTDEFPEIAGITAAIGTDAILDGELVSFDNDGLPDFSALRKRLGSTQPHPNTRRCTFVAFDLLHLGDERLTRQSYAERREQLQSINLKGPAWQTPRHFTGADAHNLVDATAERRLEGVVWKKLDAPYVSGRSRAWLKQKHRHRETFVITGVAPAAGREPERLLLARRVDGGQLEPAGSVSFGLSMDERDRLREQLLVPTPARTRSRITWVEPTVQVDVDYHGSGRVVRDPVLRAIR